VIGGRGTREKVRCKTEGRGRITREGPREGPCDNAVRSADRTKNGTGGSERGLLLLVQRDALYRTEREEARVALAVSIGSISLSSCQLFLCARQIVADDGDGSPALRKREKESEGRGEKSERERPER
jgi:hypothetical protein